MKRILIVEDDKTLRNELKIFLENNGYNCDILQSFDNTVESILRIQPELLLLDINLPHLNGQYICREIRKQSDLPIIIITSRDNELDELLSLNYGADHYVTKPFNLQILLAKIAALLRRTSSSGESVELITNDRFTVNIAKGIIESFGKSSELTKNEFKILNCLLQNKNKIVSREDIMQFLWEDESFVDDNTLTVNIARLRKKLDEIGLQDLIKTRRGQGYLLDLSD